jgi:hypothetical protein
MTKRMAKRLLWSLSVAASCGAVLTIGLAIGRPLTLPAVQGASEQSMIPPSSRGDAIPPLSEWAKVWSIDLGHEGIASPSAPAPGADAPATQIAPPDVHLIGTIIEPGHCMAILVGPDGKTVFLRVGDHVQDARISAIAVDSITVQANGKPMVFTVEKPPPDAAPKPAVITLPEDQ